MTADTVRLESLPVGAPAGVPSTTARTDARAPQDRPLRILMVAHKYLPFIGGIEMHVHQVATRMVALGHSVTVLTADPDGKLPVRETTKGIDVVRVRAYPKDRDYFFSPGVFGKVDAGAVDIIHVQGYHTLTPPVAMLAAIVKRVPFVMTFHSGGHSSKARQMMRGPQHAVMAPLVKRAAGLIGVSQFEADHFSQTLGIPRDRFVVVPNGAKFEAPETSVTSDPAAPLLLSIGRLERYKGHHIAIQAFAELVKSKPAARLRVVGEGNYEGELRQLVERLGLGRSVTIRGIPPSQRSEMAALMAEARLVVLLSEYEAHPVAVLESLSLGKRVLAADTSGFTEMGRAGQIRCIPLQSSSAEIAAAMAEELDNTAPPSLVDLPDWDSCTARLIEIYRSVLAKQA